MNEIKVSAPIGSKAKVVRIRASQWEVIVPVERVQVGDQISIKYKTDSIHKSKVSARKALDKLLIADIYRSYFS